MLKKMITEEFIEEIDNFGKVIAIHPRDELKKRMFKHKVSLIIPRNTNSKFILGKRAKDKFPFADTWCCAIGGKVSAGETYENAAIREMIEESSHSTELEKVCDFNYDKSDYQAIFRVFTTKKNISVNDLKANPEEIQYFDSFNIKEIKEMIKNNPNNFAPTFREALINFTNNLKQIPSD